MIYKQENEQLYEKIEEQNLRRQYDLLLNSIEIGIAVGPRAFDKYLYGL